MAKHGLHVGILSLWVSLTAALFTACTPKVTTEGDESKAATIEASATVDMTSGQFNLERIPQEGITAREVVIVTQIAPETNTRLLQQRALFEAKLLNQSATDPASGLSVADTEKFAARLFALRQAYPPVLDAERDAGNLRKERFRSDLELFKQFAGDFKAITLENVQRALPIINERIHTAGKALETSLETSSDLRRIQLELDLEWLTRLSRHLSNYVPLANDLAKAKNAAQRQNGQAGAEPQFNTWEAYMQHYDIQLLGEIYKYSIGSAEVAADGSFTVKGHGVIILRVDYNEHSVYFLPEDPDEKRVKVSSISKYQE